MNKNITAEIVSVKGLQAEKLQLFKDILDTGTDLRVRATGRSMKPFLKGGEILTIRRVPGASMGKGDLILFDSQGSLILHRIIKKYISAEKTLIFQTQGDAMTLRDEPVPQQKILGKVLKIERTTASGATRQMDLQSWRCKALNYFIAIITPVRMSARRTLLNY